MRATADRSTAAPPGDADQLHGPSGPLARVDGLELLGEVDGSGYANGAALVRRADGQMVQLGPLMYALLDEIDGERDSAELASALCERLGRACDAEHVDAIAEKLAEQGLVAGSEANAPARANPLLALRWKVVATDPDRTRRITSPFTILHRAWIVLPVLVAFLAVCWFVLIDKGVAAAAAQAFDKPELILLVFALGVASAGFHELGHASACRYGGGTPGAMGAGIYLVWPAFYTDVTDAYRLPRGARLRTDLGGLYFNSIVAVATLGAWLVFRVDALLLLIGLQLLEMVKQLSPVIRADGYHILADATGVPDLYAHIGPTLTGWLPGRRGQAAALRGRARVVVTLWVLVIVPVMLSLALSAVLLLPTLAASTWASASHIVAALPGQASGGHVVDLLVGVLRLFALTLPVIGSVLIVKRIVGGVTKRASSWSRGRPVRQGAVVLFATCGACLAGWAWWPAGQYQPVRAEAGGRIGQVGQLVSSRTNADTSGPSSSQAGTRSAAANAAPPVITPGTHLAVSLVPEGGATKEQPALFVITDPSGDSPPVLLATSTSPAPTGATDTSATAFNFALPDAPGKNDSQALAVNRTDGGITYRVAYSLVTVRDGADVDERNGAYALGNCNACATVAISFQVVLVVGNSQVITPINIAEAINGNCPACVTLAIANQIVVSVGEEPSQDLLDRLNTELAKLDAIDVLGPDATPESISAQVAAVQQGVNQILVDSGVKPPPADTTSTTDATGTNADQTAGSDATQPTTDPDTTSTDATTDTTAAAPTSTTPTEPTTTATTSTTQTTTTP